MGHVMVRFERCDTSRRVSFQHERGGTRRVHCRPHAGEIYNNQPRGRDDVNRGAV